MASTSALSDVWGKITYRMQNSDDVLESADVRGERYVIGRAKGCDLRIGLKMISGHHCYLGKDTDGKIFLYDTSTNGTTVNGNRVINGQRQEIFDGDKLYLVLKKSSPDQDFYLNFKTVPSSKENRGSGTSGAEPKTKRLKVETVSSSSALQVGSELNNDVDGNEIVSDTTAQSNTVSSLNPSSSEMCEVEIKQEEEVVVGEDDNTKNEEDKLDVNNVDKVVSSTSSDTSVDDILKCSLCLEIFHDPVCLQPCMHCYCSGCYSEWMACSNECPQCRTPVKLLAKNHMINALTESYLKSNPEKRRSLSEIALLESKGTYLKNFAPNNEHPSNCQCVSCSYSSSYESNTDSPVVHCVPTRSTCQQCPGNINTSNATSMSQASSSATTQSTPFVCGPSQAHIACSCCYRLMPDRRYEANVQPQTCELCLSIFCHMYWGCTKLGCSGCLNKFSDLKYASTNLLKMVNKNLVETRILTDYAESKGTSIQTIIEECLRHLDAGTYRLAINLKSDSVLCYKCGFSNMQTLIYKYRASIPDSDLPDSVTSRPDCYWGSNCRTQKHNLNHAQKYNHICNQTRF